MTVMTMSCEISCHWTLSLPICHGHYDQIDVNIDIDPPPLMWPTH